jgi:hypothetical protein
MDDRIRTEFARHPQQLRPEQELLEPNPNDPPHEGRTIPSNCLRVLHSPRGECHDPYMGRCEAMQQDGTCLADIVREARERGIELTFDVRVDQYGNRIWEPVELVEPEPSPTPIADDVWG